MSCDLRLKTYHTLRPPYGLFPFFSLLAVNNELRPPAAGRRRHPRRSVRSSHTKHLISTKSRQPSQHPTTRQRRRHVGRPRWLRANHTEPSLVSFSCFANARTKVLTSSNYSVLRQRALKRSASTLPVGRCWTSRGTLLVHCLTVLMSS